MNKGDLIRIATEKDVKNEVDYLENQLNIKIDGHIENTILDPKGVHGLRVQRGKLEFKDENGDWELVAGGDSPNFADIENIEVTEDDGKIEIKWSDPQDVVFEGIVLTKWKGTKLIRKEGSFPANENDGVVVVENGVRNQYKDKPFIDSGLTNEKTYYYMLVPFSDDGQHTLSKSNQFKATPASSRVYGVVIDNNNANPETRVKYIDDAVGFKPLRGNNGNTDWGSWKDTFVYKKFKPCVVKNGEVQYYLNKDDFTKKEDGSNATLTGADGDVMIEIDKMWYRLDNHGDKQYVRVSDSYQDGFKCLAHTRGDKEVDKIYVGTYLGYEQSGKLRSISGVAPTENKTIGDFRNLAEANGDRYHQVPFTALTLLQSIMTIMLKSTDTQTALGRGRVDASSFAKTGTTNSKDMMYGTTSVTTQMCFMGIEDFWGNLRWWIDGLKYDGGKIKLATTNFNDNASGYEVIDSYSEVGWGYIKSVKGTTETGFIPTNTSGSSSTYFCDEGDIRDGGFPYFGGGHDEGSLGGGFYLYSGSASDSYSALGSRLFMYGK